MDRQTLRDWVIRYNAHGVAGLTDNWQGGRPISAKIRLAPENRL
jgi:transposase